MAAKISFDLSGATEARTQCRELGEHDWPAPAQEGTPEPGVYGCGRCGALMVVAERLAS